MSLPRNAQIWFPGYCKSLFRSRPPCRHVWVIVADHYEPLYGRASFELGMERVRRWRTEWPAIASRHCDSDGRPPRYSFFYPEEEYRPEYLSALAEMTELGIGDVEIHLHHDGEGEADFVDRMSRFKETLFARHGLLRRAGGQVAFGFIHGNWALDNSLPNGRWCGLNNEITLLKQLGCYADFTLPSAPSAAQTRTVNSIYWATDDPARPKSHDRGVAVRIGGGIEGDLLMVQGPLTVRFRADGRWMPRLEMGELASQDPPTPDRVRAWLDVAPRLGDHAFVKLHTHGTQERNSAMLLGGGLDRLYSAFTEEARRRNFEVHFGSAWEAYQAIERLRTGNTVVEAVPA